MGPTCSIEGCHKEVKARNLCAMHHQRLLRTGDPLYRKKKACEQSCLWFGCGNPSSAKGFCKTHYAAVRYQMKIGVQYQPVDSSPIHN